MRLDKYITRSEDIPLCSQAEEIRVVQIIFEAAERRVKELRFDNEEKPKECPEDLTKDFRGVSGEIRGLNWVLGLPERSREFINKIK